VTEKNKTKADAVASKPAPVPPRDPAPSAPVAMFDRGYQLESQPPPIVEKK